VLKGTHAASDGATCGKMRVAGKFRSPAAV
jgi:hypothetical protein